MKSHIIQPNLTHTVIIKNNSYGVTNAAAEKILSQSREYAPQGALYALRKNTTFMLINETESTTEYEKNGFEVLRKK